MHDRLFASQQTLGTWQAHAEAVGLDATKFEECLNSGRHSQEIRGQIAQAQKAGVTGAPTFFLAYTDPKSSKVKTVARLTGAQPYASFKAAIDRLLEAGQPEAPKEKGAEK